MNDTVKIFTGTRTIGESRYCVHIPAKSWDDAKQLFLRIGATLDGELVEEQQTNLCGICGGPISKDYTKPEPVINDSWPEDIS